jgi:hypothetical protein
VRRGVITSCICHALLYPGTSRCQLALFGAHPWDTQIWAGAASKSMSQYYSDWIYGKTSGATVWHIGPREATATAKQPRGSAGPTQ